MESKPFQPGCYKGTRKKNDEPSDMVRNSSACVKYRSRPAHDMLKHILGYIHGKVRMLFTGIEICKNDIKCCIFVILCRYCRIIMFFFLFDKIRIAIYKKQNNHDSV